MALPHERLWAACRTGDLTTVVDLARGDMDIHVHNDAAFRWACSKGRLEVAKWLVGQGGVDIHASNDDAFQWSCHGCHFQLVRWLVGLDVQYTQWPQWGLERLRAWSWWSGARTGWMRSVVQFQKRQRP